ncbi:GNAT family N-acetyltransferase [Flavobacteriaceae bacterium]|jgi:GNAT superfamily N-acetyltransferase|nr:GNAT family N-acetyltransferase [Flavobacteriaceae bacterium]MDC1195619.1 GNAT family N-acetyltransferase [Flavobacteriaceae bacterium]MDG1384917.1 GNAT family N-acetyltransferase [Flavobacteriaceae bacterium]
METDIVISSEKMKLNVDFIYTFISKSYWAKGRTLETMQTCIDNSLNFGVYLDDQQIGYARIATDFGQFAYIMDLFISENYRGKGYSKKLMKAIMNSEKLKTINVWRLATHDAHKLYEQFGFKAIDAPEKLMEFLK